MLLVKKYEPSGADSQGKVKLLLLAPVESLDECTYVVLKIDEYSRLNKAKMHLDNIIQSEIRKLEFLSLRDSCERESSEWKAYNRKLKSASIIRLRIVRRVIGAMGLGPSHATFDQ